jgi:tRNA 2-thiouridine synthesizing protein A
MSPPGGRNEGAIMRRTEDGLSSKQVVSPGFATPSTEVIRMDCTGMRCPQPVLRLAAETAEAPAGTIVEIAGDCPTFEKDVRVFCERRKKTLLAIRTDGAKKLIQIQY